MFRIIIEKVGKSRKFKLVLQEFTPVSPSREEMLTGIEERVDESVIDFKKLRHIRRDAVLKADWKTEQSAINLVELGESTDFKKICRIKAVFEKGRLRAWSQCVGSGGVGRVGGEVASCGVCLVCSDERMGTMFFKGIECSPARVVELCREWEKGGGCYHSLDVVHKPIDYNIRYIRASELGGK